MFLNHTQSPLTVAQKAVSLGLFYFDYDPMYCVVGRVETAVSQQTYHLHLPADGDLTYTRIAKIHFEINKKSLQLSLYWIEGYGGGLFLPFQDTTNKKESYGSGRYLYDGIKGADLGTTQTEILLDFNFAYNPSCAYNSAYTCPLPPPDNKLTIPILAGERHKQ